MKFYVNSIVFSNSIIHGYRTSFLRQLEAYLESLRNKSYKFMRIDNIKCEIINFVKKKNQKSRLRLKIATNQKFLNNSITLID